MGTFLLFSITGMVSAIDDSDVDPSPGSGSSVLTPGDILFVYDVQTPTGGDDQILGVEFDGTYYYVTGGGGTVSGFPNLLHFYQADGTYVTSIPQGTSDTWGWRDLAFDGNHMYASCSDFAGVYEFHVTGLPGAPSIVIDAIHPGAGLNPDRALAYDPATGHFWTASFSSDIFEFSLDGTIHNQYSNPVGGTYGMAWDDLSTDGPWLWIHNQFGTGYEIHQFDPVTGTYTGLVYSGAGAPGDAAGGLCMIEQTTRDTMGILVGITQGSPVDIMYGMELTTVSGGPGPAAPVGGFSETIGAIELLAPYILTIVALAGIVAISVVYTKRKTE